MLDQVKYLVPRAEFTDLTTTTETTIYTAPDVWTYLHKLHVSNVTGSAATITVSIYDDSETTLFSWVTTKSVPANDLMDFELDFQLAEGDEVRVQAGTADALEVALTFTEQGGRSG